MIRQFIQRILRKSDIARLLAIVSLFLVLSAVIGGVTSLFNRKPSLDTVEPSIGAPGDIVVMRGKHFGETKEDNWIEISGNRVSGNEVINWTDTLIMMRLPEILDDGLVYVVNRHGRSNPQIFVNRDNLPVAARGNAEVGAPVIESLDAKAAEIGKRLTIKGKNFGITRNASEVLFTWQIDAAIPQATSARMDQTMVPCSPLDFDYESWGDQEIRVRVPDGASSGAVYVRTERGTSGPAALEIINSPGTKKYSDPRTYTVTVEMDVSGVNASEGNMLFVRVPLPVTTAAQKNVSVTQSADKPYVDDYHGAILHQIENLKTGRNEVISHSIILTNHSVTTAVNPALVKQYSDTQSPLYAVYTANDPLVPSDDASVRNRAATIVGQERNPYKKANLIYAWLVENFREGNVPKPERDAVEALKAGSGDAWDMAILFAALCRAAGVPAVPNAGVLVDAQRNSRVHWWAEFYVESFGWIPVDPALGAGFPQKTRGDEAKAWYFGNLDADHIAFSRGWSEQKPMTPKGRIVFKPRFYSFQPIWEESGGNIKSYASFWGDPKVTGVYNAGQ